MTVIEKATERTWELGHDNRSIQIGYRRYCGLSAEVAQGADPAMTDKVRYSRWHSTTVLMSPTVMLSKVKHLPVAEILRRAQDDRSPVFARWFSSPRSTASRS